MWRGAAILFNDSSARRLFGMAAGVLAHVKKAAANERDVA